MFSVLETEQFLFLVVRWLKFSSRRPLNGNPLSFREYSLSLSLTHAHTLPLFFNDLGVPYLLLEKGQEPVHFMGFAIGVFDLRL